MRSILSRRAISGRAATGAVAALLAGSAAIVLLFRFHHTPQAPSPCFPQLFPRPTGKNGYEDFAAALDIAATNASWRDFEGRDYEAADASYDAKRLLLFDPGVRRVLTTLKTGLSKPVRTPRSAPELDTLPPELNGFRSLGRLLAVEMETRFLDGQTADATECLKDGLAFGHSVQVGTLLSGVVGLYIENLMLRRFADHLDRLSGQDSDRALQILRQHFSLPDPQLSLITQERAMYVRSLDRHRSDAMALLDKLDPGPNASRSDHENYNSVCSLIRADPSQGPRVFTQASELACAHFDQTLAELKKPCWQRVYSEPADRTSPPARLFYSMFPPSYARMGGRYASEEALARILATHVAILSYWHRVGRLPANLDEARAANVAIDPFTGGPLQYTVQSGQAYEVGSIGPLRAGQPPAQAGERAPIVIAYPPSHQPQR